MPPRWSRTQSGTPFVAYAQLSNAAPGPIPFLLYVNGALYTMPTPGNAPGQNERIYLTNLTVSSNGSQALITIDDGAANARKLLSAYLGTTLAPTVLQIAPGVGRLQFGQVPRATASAVSGGATVECVANGYIART